MPRLQWGFTNFFYIPGIVNLMLWCLTPHYFYNITAILSHTFPSDLQVPRTCSAPPCRGAFWGWLPRTVPLPLPNLSSFGGIRQTHGGTLVTSWVKGNKFFTLTWGSAAESLGNERQSSQFGKRFPTKGPRKAFPQWDKRAGGISVLGTAHRLRWNNSFVVRLRGNSKEKWGDCLLTGGGCEEEGENGNSKGCWSDQKRKV